MEGSSCSGCYRMSVEKYVCIHGHFYQPPRENPWLEYVELQDSAYPYHDWNERITAECYAPNGRSRILNQQGKIAELVNNYSWMSFNVGPTLLSWLAQQAPEVYKTILEGDQESRQRFSGHGSALAQAYNHMILPLANPRDIATQIVWGIEDFRHRFKRDPEGMWLPEAAVDTRSLEVLAKNGIRFTILAPTQVKRIRPIGTRNWTDVSGGRHDPTMPYLVRLRSGVRITVFIYDGPISRALAFENLLDSGEAFVDRLMGAFRDDRAHAQIVNIATDGETYGHHRRHAEMALSYATRKLAAGDTVRLTNYGEYLETHPPTFELEIFNNSSWSCIHGVERWRNDCGCNSGRSDWNQAWRGPLRESLDWLRDRMAPLYEEQAGKLLKDPWAARNEYIDVVLDRSAASQRRFFQQHARHPLSGPELTRAIKLLELQRHALLMYTSCGWFFDEISGIETVQVLEYASRAMQLGEELLGVPLERPFLLRLERAHSNLPELGTGRAVYEKFVRPSVVDLSKVGAHYAVSSLFEEYGDRTRIYAYEVEREEVEMLQNGRMRLAVGRARITSDITGETARISYGVLHLGDHNLSGGVRLHQGDQEYELLKREVKTAFGRADLPDLIRSVDRNFGAGTYSLKFLFRDEQRKILDRILESTRADAENTYRHMYEQHAPLLRFLHDLGILAPRRLQVAAELALRIQTLHALQEPQLDVEKVGRLIQEARQTGVELQETSDLGFALAHAMERLARSLRANAEQIALLQKWLASARLARTVPFATDLWQVQNIYYDMALVVLPLFRRRAQDGDAEAQRWKELFTQLGQELAVRLPVEVPASGPVSVA